MKSNAKILFPLISAFIWGTAFVAQSLGADDIAPFGFNMIRNAIASVFLLVMVIVFDKVHKRDGAASYEKYLREFEIPDGMSLEDFQKKQRKGLLVGGILCGLALSAAMNLQQSGVADSGAGKAGFITALYVVAVPVFSVFLGKKVSLKSWVCVVLAVIGLYLICVKEGFSVAPSDSLLLGCALMFTIQMLLVDHYARYVDGVKLSCVQFIVVTIVSAILTLAFEGVPSAQSISAAIIPLLYTGLLSSGIAYTLQIISQREVNPTLVSLLMCTEAVFALIAGVIILDERLLPREYIGCIIMFGAVIISQIPSKVLKRNASNSSLNTVPVISASGAASESNFNQNNHE